MLLQWNLYNETKKVHCLYKIMFIIPAMRDHLSWETRICCGRFIQVSLYLWRSTSEKQSSLGWDQNSSWKNRIFWHIKIFDVNYRITSKKFYFWYIWTIYCIIRHQWVNTKENVFESRNNQKESASIFILMLSNYCRWTCSCVFFLFVIKVVWAQWHHLSSSSWIWTTLAQVMACCLVSPSHYLT